jgi:hypothetical protein
LKNNWYQRQLERIADMHGSMLAKSPKNIKKLIASCVGVSISDDDAIKIASVVEHANNEYEICAALKETGKIPIAAAKSLAHSMMPIR